MNNLETEDNCSHQDGELLHYMDGKIKIEETVLNWSVSKYECSICGEIFTNESSLDYHVNAQHHNCEKEVPEQSIGSVEHRGKVDINECEYKTSSFIGTEKSKDNAYFHKVNQLDPHMIKIEEEIVSNQGISKYECSVHSDEKLYTSQQSESTTSFKTNNSLDTHTGVHNGEKLFECKQIGCSMSFARKKHLNDHKKMHSDMEQYNCQQNGCTKSFRSRTSLNTHIKVHSTLRPFKCPEPGCLKSFKRNYALKDHIRVHTGERSFKCEQSGCTLWFKRKSELNDHMRVHIDERPFKCEQPECSLLFKRKKELNVHMRVHSDKRPFKCQNSECTKLFKSRGDLVTHMKTHNGERPFSCKHTGCSKSFKRKTDLHRHVRVHGGERVVNYEEVESTVENGISVKPDFEMEDELKDECIWLKSEDAPNGEIEFQEQNEYCMEHSKS